MTFRDSRTPTGEKPLRILFASFDEVPAFKGGSTHILAGCRRVVPDCRLTLMTLGRSRLPRLPGFTHLPVELNDPNFLRRAELFREKVSEELRRDPPDVFHFRSPWEGMAGQNFQGRQVFEVNAMPTVELPYLYPNIPPHLFALIRNWEQQCLDRAHVVLCPSERIAEFLGTQYAVTAEKIRILPNGYDPVEVARPSVPSEGPLRLVYLGALQPWQGLHWSLSSLRRFRAEELRLDIYTQASKIWFRALEKRIRKWGLEDRVRILAPMNRREMAQRLPRYDMGFCPMLKTERNTLQGCYPVKIVDYLAHELPTLASNLYVSRQLLTQGETAILFEPNRLQALEATLRQMIENRAVLGPMRETIRKSNASRLTWDDYGIRLRSIYQNLANGSQVVQPLSL